MLAVEDNLVIYDSLFAFMANIENEKEKEVTLSDIMENLDNYTTRKIKRLTSVLIDYVCELTTEKNALEEKVENTRA